MSWSLQAAGKGQALADEIKRQASIAQVKNTAHADFIARASAQIEAAINLTPDIALKVSASGAIFVGNDIQSYHNYNVSVETLWGGLHV